MELFLSAWVERKLRLNFKGDYSYIKLADKIKIYGFLYIFFCSKNIILMYTSISLFVHFLTMLIK